MGEEDKKIAELSRLSRDIPNLIRGIEKIKSRREGIIDATKARFNVFTILLQAHDEVRLHTRFITAMLDGSKHASHGCGTLFLRLFLKTIDKINVDGVNVGLIHQFTSLLEDDKEFESIHKEYHTGDKGNIDILIMLKDAAIAIENKIYAGEQENQLLGYSEYLRDRTNKSSKYLLFLTLEGHNADSSGDKSYFKISYQKHIIPWLDLCLEKTYSYPNINSVILQYKKVVQQLLSNNSFEEEDMKEIKELIEKNPAIVKYLCEISKCVEDVKKEYQGKFIAKLAEKVPGLNPASNWESPSGDMINFCIASSNNFFKDNNLTLLLDIHGAFSNNSQSYIGVAYSQNSQKLSGEAKAIVNNIKNRLFSEQNYFEPNKWWPAGGNEIAKDNNILTQEWLFNMLSNPDSINRQATEYADEIKRYIRIIEDCVKYN